MRFISSCCLLWLAFSPFFITASSEIIHQRESSLEMQFRCIEDASQKTESGILCKMLAEQLTQIKFISLDKIVFKSATDRPYFNEMIAREQLNITSKKTATVSSFSFSPAVITVVHAPWQIPPAKSLEPDHDQPGILTFRSQIHFVAEEIRIVWRLQWGSQVLAEGQLNASPMELALKMSEWILNLKRKLLADQVRKITLKNIETSISSLKINEVVFYYQISTTAAKSKVLEIDPVPGGRNQITILDNNNRVWRLEADMTQGREFSFDFSQFQLLPDPQKVLFKSPKVLQINSVPQGASLFVNRSFVGETPFLLRAETVEIYALRLEKEGFASLQKDVIVTSESKNEHEFSFVLNQNPGQNPPVLAVFPHEFDFRFWGNASLIGGAAFFLGGLYGFSMLTDSRQYLNVQLPGDQNLWTQEHHLLWASESSKQRQWQAFSTTAFIAGAVFSLIGAIFHITELFSWHKSIESSELILTRLHETGQPMSNQPALPMSRFEGVGPVWNIPAAATIALRFFF